MKREVFAVLITFGLLLVTGESVFGIIAENEDIEPMIPEFDFQFSGGNGTKINPYKISNITELQWMGNTSNLDKHFIFINDINASATLTWNGGNGFDPVGDSSNRFDGSINGNGYKIINLLINRSSDDFVGLVGDLGVTGYLSNITMLNASINGEDICGILAGRSFKGTIHNCSVNGSVKGSTNIGGLVGRNHEGKISNCFSGCNVIGRGQKIGGMVGYNEDAKTFENCSSRSYVKGTENVGGLIGDNEGSFIEWSNSTSMVIGTGAVGGLIGYNHFYSRITNCHSRFEINSTRDNIGGLIGKNQNNCPIFHSGSIGKINGRNQLGGIAGYNNQKIINSSSEVEITGQSMIGGLVGENHGEIRNCTADAEIEGVQRLGGLVGDGRDKSIYDSISYGNVTGTTYYIGGFVGGIISIDVINCRSYANVNSTGEYVGGFAGYPSLSNIKNSLSDCEVKGETNVGGFLGVNSYCIIENCHSFGWVNSTKDYTGGFIGLNLGTISNCSSLSNVNGKKSTGGLIGKNNNNYEIKECFSNGNVTGTDYIGGLIGENYGKILNCYSQGGVNGPMNKLAYFGGLLGYNNGRVTNSYSTGKVTGTFRKGFIGDNYGTVQNSFWDYESSGVTYSDGGTGKNSSEMKSQNTFSSAGWDFNETWYIIEDETYPMLSNNLMDYSVPVFLDDYTNISGSTGTNFTFNISVTDNIGLSFVMVEFWYGNGSHLEKQLKLNNTYKTFTELPVNSTDTLYYFFHARDFKGNTNSTPIKNVTINDILIPFFSNETTQNNGTTGDQFQFKIYAYDNIGIQNVYLEYWSNFTKKTNVSMEENGYFIKNILLPSNVTNISYQFHAVDLSFNWKSTDVKTLLVLDNDKPLFGKDLTADNWTTGDIVEFSIIVQDNINVNSVKIEYWFGSGPRFNESMVFDSGSYTFDLMIPPDSLDQLHYIFHAVDTSGNWNRTDQIDVAVLDDDRPIFGMDGSAVLGTTGEQYRFGIGVVDNIGIEEVKVEYWFGEGPHTNVTMTGGGPFSHIADIPLDSSETLHYIFHASDTSGNWNHTPQVDVDILDNDLPAFMEDLSDTTATTGDNFSFEIEVTDNIGISDVYVEYWFGTGDHNNESMISVDSFGLRIEIPSDSVERLNYIFHAVDESGNWAHTDRVDIQIADNDMPEMIADESPDEAFTGEDLEIIIRATDNIGLAEVELIWMIGSDIDEQRVDMDLESGNYVHTIQVPVDTVDPLRYVMRIIDTSGNIFESDEATITITDSISPTVDPVDDITVYDGQDLDVNVTGSDNIGIASYSWEGAPIDADGSELKGIVTVPGDHDITVTISDEEGNTDSTTFRVTVLAEDHDTDSDGIPDLVEMEWGLSIEDPSDGEEDADNDGMSNALEYANGTLPFDDDTDDDGMPDGWEDSYGLDPTTSSSDNDADGDGKTDLEEYREGTDPLIKEKEDDDDGGGSPIVIIVIIAVVILIAIGLLLFFLTRKKEEKLENEPSDGQDTSENAIEDPRDDENENP